MLFRYQTLPVACTMERFGRRPLVPCPGPWALGPLVPWSLVPGPGPLSRALGSFSRERLAKGSCCVGLHWGRVVFPAGAGAGAVQHHRNIIFPHENQGFWPWGLDLWPWGLGAGARPGSRPKWVQMGQFGVSDHQSGAKFGQESNGMGPGAKSCHRMSKNQEQMCFVGRKKTPLRGNAAP